MIFKRIVLNEYYLFSSDGYALAVRYYCCGNRLTTGTLISSNSWQQWAFMQQQILYDHEQHFSNVAYFCVMSLLNMNRITDFFVFFVINHSKHLQIYG